MVRGQNGAPATGRRPGHEAGRTEKPCPPDAPPNLVTPAEKTPLHLPQSITSADL